MNELEVIKILLVEDEWSHAKLVEVFLAGTTQLEVDITHVLSLKECLETLNKQSYDVVLLDLNLGDSNGINTLESLFEKVPDASVVLLTGNDDDRVGITAIQKGAQDFLNKNHLDTATLTKAVLYAHQRKELQADLAYSNQKLKEAQELAKLGNYQIDIDQKKIFWSDQLFKLLGLPVNSKSSYRAYLRTVIELDRARVIQQIRTTLKNLGEFNIEHKIKVNNKIFYVRNAGRVYLDEISKSRKMIGTVQDITEYKEAENQLQENRKRYEIIFNDSQEAIYVSTFEGQLKDRNTAFLKLVGCTEEQLDKMENAASHFYVNQEDRKEFKRIIEEKGVVKNYPIQLKKYSLDNNPNQDEIIDCEISASLWKDSDGKILGYQGLIRDITEQKRTKALRHAAEVDAKAAKIKNEFLANMSHEIRTPMNVVVTAIDLLENTPLADKQKDYLSSMKISSENLLVIINAILDFSKIEQGKMDLETKPFDLHKLIEKLFQTFIYKAKQKNISLFKQLDANLPNIIIGDRFRLNQILVNLVSNALKYTNEGEINLKIKLLEETDEEVNIQFEVEDSGIGIPKDKQDSIFSSFTQASDDTTRLYGGTGLGLAIAKRLVGLMKGEISVKSEPDKGSTFIFNAVFAKDNSKDNEIRPIIDTEIIANYDTQAEIQLLLVEDHEMNQVVVSDLLEREFENIKIDLAENGKVAIDKVKENFYHLVLMDINMPVMGGLEATREIRKSLPAPKNNIPIFALTAHAFSTEVQNCKNAGMNEFISKPIKIKDLKSKIIRLLNQVIPAKKDELAVAKPNGVHLNGTTNQINGINIATNLKDNTVQNEYESVIDLESLKQISENDTNKLQRYINLLLKNTPNELEKLKQDTENEDWDELTKIAHKLKGTVGYMGIKKIEETIRIVENNSARKLQLEDIPKQVEEVVKYCNLGLKELEKIIM